MEPATTTSSLESTKYLMFSLADQAYGVDISKVHEIVAMMEITPIPQTMPFVKGVIHLRGKIIPVIDLRLKFGFAEIPYTTYTCMIIVDVEGRHLGIIVDTVCDVLTLSSDELAQASSFIIPIRLDFIQAIDKVDDRVNLLLNIDRVLTSEELVNLEEIARS